MTLKDEFEDALQPEDGPKAWAEISPDGVEISTGPLPHEIADDWAHVLQGFGLDPAVFEVVDDTVRCSKWQQSKRLANGDRDVVWLYSYRARFRKRVTPLVTEDDLAVIRRQIGKWKPAKQVAADATEPSTFVVCLADWQLGKSAGGGVEATVKRITDSYDAIVHRLVELRMLGRTIEHVAIVNMGDPIEGCAENYSSQTFTVELNLRQQLLLALDLMALGVARFSALAEGATFVSVLCNHGEWMRRGGKSITSDSDNASGFLADALFRVFQERPEAEKLDWIIPHDEMTVTAVFSGVKVAFNHGHMMPSYAKEADWIRGQSIRILREERREPDIWVTAHRHHLSVVDFGAYTRIQCPTMDGGSKWWTDQTGLWSSTGTLTFLVGRHDPRGWSDVAVV